MSAAQETLEQHRDRLRKELGDLGFHPDSEEFAGDLDRGFADSAHSTAERARLIALAKELRENLKDVEHALARIEARTYGTCERCGNPIAPERLEAIPWARLCIDCKQKSGAAAR
jgi:RNA polymerase-binding transcription factor